MGRSKGSTNLTVMGELCDKALAYFRQNMSYDEAMRRAREDVAADMERLGPEEGNLRGELETIWETQRERNPGFTRPAFLANGTDLDARLRYNKACRKAMLQAYSENAMRDLIFYGTADEMFNEGELIKPVSRRRWLHYIIKKPAGENDAAAIHHNRTIVLAAALCEGAITREQYVQKMTVLYSLQGKAAVEAAAQAEADSAHPYTFLYNAMLAKFAEGKAAAEDIKRASGVILTSQNEYARMVEEGRAEEADQMLLDAYRTVSCNLSVSAMYNVANALDDLTGFGMKITADEKKNLIYKWEDVSIPLQSCTASVTQAANPYYSIFDPLELERKDVHAFTGQPGQNADFSYLYDFIFDNSRSVEGALLAEKQQMLKRYGLENHGGIRIDELSCKADPDILITTGDGRTLISYIQDVRLGKNGLYTATIRNDVPGRYMDATLLGDVQSLREKLAALPPKQEKLVRSALGKVRTSLEALAGVTLGDSAADKRMDGLHAKLKNVQTAAELLDTALRESGEKNPVLKEFRKALNAFVTDKFNIMDTIRRHKETVQLAADVEAREQKILSDGFEIPEDERGLTPMQRYLRPIEEKRARKAAEAAAEKKRLAEEEEARRTAEALRDGEKLNSAIIEAEAAVSGVEVDKRMHQDVVVEMIKAFVEGNQAASHAYYEAGDLASAKLYGKQAVAGDTVREMLEIERKNGKGDRLETLLKKGGLNSLTAMVMQSKKFKEYTDAMNMGNPEQLDKLIANPLFVAKRVALDVMRNVQAAQKKAAGAAPQNGQPQLNNAQPKPPQAGPQA